jgi:hypothetical protein
MRIIIYSVTALLICSVVAGSVPNQDRFVIPVANGTAVFANNPIGDGEQPAFTVGTSDRLMILDISGVAFKVSDLKGNVGWVNKTLVKVIHPNESIVFSDASIQGYLDNPVPVYILDANNPSEKPLTLARSFSEEMKENIDRMTLERIVGQDLLR